MAALLMLLFGILPAQAVPPETGVRVLLKVLSYDRALQERQAGALLSIGVVFEPTDPLSAAQGAEVLAVLRSMRGWTVGGLALTEGRSLPQGWVDLAAALPEVGAVIVCSGADIEELAVLAALAERPLLALDEGWVGRGPAVSLGQRQAKLRILFDHRRALAQGMDPSGELLEVAERVP